MVKKAAGLILFRRITNQIEYLLLLASKHKVPANWTPPKGHVDEGESDLVAAIRETYEESGLTEQKDYEILFRDNFTLISEYSTKAGRPKRVLYWLAEAKQNCSTIKLSHEHVEFKWLVKDEALQLLQYDAVKKLISEADDYLKDKLNLR